MSAKPRDISDLLQKRRQRIRSWVTQDSHPLVVDQVREAHAALGAMQDQVPGALKAIGHQGWTAMPKFGFAAAGLGPKDGGVAYHMW